MIPAIKNLNPNQLTFKSSTNGIRKMLLPISATLLTLAACKNNNTDTFERTNLDPRHIDKIELMRMDEGDILLFEHGNKETRIILNNKGDISEKHTLTVDNGNTYTEIYNYDSNGETPYDAYYVTKRIEEGEDKNTSVTKCYDRQNALVYSDSTVCTLNPDGSVSGIDTFTIVSPSNSNDE